MLYDILNILLTSTIMKWDKFYALWKSCSILLLVKCLIPPIGLCARETQIRHDPEL